MLSYTEHDNAQAVEIHVCGKVSTEEFDRLAQKLEAFIARHGQVRVLEQISEFEGMEAAALWHDLKFSLRHLKDFSRIAIVSAHFEGAAAMLDHLGRTTERLARLGYGVRGESTKHDER